MEGHRSGVRARDSPAKLLSNRFVERHERNRLIAGDVFDCFDNRRSLAATCDSFYDERVGIRDRREYRLLLLTPVHDDFSQGCWSFSCVIDPLYIFISVFNVLTPDGVLLELIIFSSYLT